MSYGSHTDTVVMRSRRSRAAVNLTCQHKNRPLVVEGPEITVRPVGVRRWSVRGRFCAEELQAMIDLYSSGTLTGRLLQQKRTLVR